MILWRVSNRSTLDGGGGLSASGRWHTRGRRIVYCAPNPATALLEVLVHASIGIEDVPVNFRYLEIQVPAKLAVEDQNLSVLGPTWHTDLEATRRTGDDWLRSSRTSAVRDRAGHLECADQPPTSGQRPDPHRSHPSPRYCPPLLR